MYAHILFIFSFAWSCIIPLKPELLSYFTTVYIFYTLATCCTKQQPYAVTNLTEIDVDLCISMFRMKIRTHQATNVRLSTSTKRYTSERQKVQ